MTCSGETVASASSPIGRADVFVAMIVFGPACIASSRKISFLTSIFSEAASMTNCTSRNSIGAVEATIRARTSFLVFLSQEEIADQVLSQFRFAKIDDRIQLKSERLLGRSKKAFFYDFESTRGSWIVIACGRNFLVDLRRDRDFAFSLTQLFPG